MASIRCQNCNGENMIGAIFCRGCGQKLNLDEIRPDSLQDKEKTGAGALAIVRRIVVVVLLVVVLGFLGLMFMPSPGANSGSVPEDVAKKLQDKYTAMQQDRPRVREYKFTSEEITHLANFALALGKVPDDAGFALAPERISVECLGNNRVRFVLRSRVKGMPVDSTAVGAFEVTADGIRFHLISAKVGKASLFSGMKPMVLKRFATQLENKPELDKIRSRIEKLQIDENSVCITLKK
jgi:hypothetical protein